MGKYSREMFEAEAPNMSIFFILRKIANELAEANRLKRAELNLFLIKEIDPAQFAQIDSKELVDQA